MNKFAPQRMFFTIYNDAVAKIEADYIWDWLVALCWLRLD